MRDCEAEERIARALYELDGMGKNRIIDLPKLERILRGETCTHKAAN